MPFESWAIVEIMGHVKLSGKVSEEVIAGATMLRVDVPKTSKQAMYTRYYSSASLYSITPTDEATATRAAEAFNVEPVSPWILKLPESPALAEKVIEYDGEDDDPYQWEGRTVGVDLDDDEIMNGLEKAADEAKDAEESKTPPGPLFSDPPPDIPGMTVVKTQSGRFGYRANDEDFRLDSAGHEV